MILYLLILLVVALSVLLAAVAAELVWRRDDLARERTRCRKLTKENQELRDACQEWAQDYNELEVCVEAMTLQRDLGPEPAWDVESEAQLKALEERDRKQKATPKATKRRAPAPSKNRWNHGSRGR